MSHVNDDSCMCDNCASGPVSTLEVAEKMYGRGSIAYEFVRAELNRSELIEVPVGWCLDGVTVEIVGNAINLTGHATLPGKIHSVNMSIAMNIGGDAACTYCNYGNGATGLAMLDGSSCPRCHGSKVEPAE